MADIIFRSHRADVERAMKRAIDIAMESVAQQAEGNAIEEVTKLVYETPPSPTYVRTGDLRKYITHEYVPSEQTAYIGTPIEYAPYVEFGTRKMHARPFLRNAIENYVSEYRSILNDILSNS